MIAICLVLLALIYLVITECVPSRHLKVVVFSESTSLSKLQKVPNNAAKLLFRPTRSAHVIPMLHSLHWLPIEQRIEYKLSLLCYKIISHHAPIYLSELLHHYTPSRQLRSSADTRAFRIPSSGQWSVHSHTRLQLFETSSRFLSVILPVSSFGSSLKTFLFSKPFSSAPLP